MSNADPIAALYDHERDPSADGGGRRRDAHDWGADDLFDGTSYRGRRFERADAGASAQRGPATSERGTATRQRVVADWFADEDEPRAADDRADDGDRAYDGRADAHGDRAYDGRAYAYDDRAYDGRTDAHDDRAYDDEPYEDDPRGAFAVSATAPTLELDLPIGSARPARRTVTVTGHPEATRRAERAIELHHRRPGRSIDDRIGHRPDHIAAYACALGFLLILIAVLTASP